MKKLYRIRKNGMIAGVCAGLGQYFGIDPTLVRLAFVFLAFYHFLGGWVYLVLALLLPPAPEGYEDTLPAVNLMESGQTTKVIGGGLILIGILAFISMMNTSWLSWMHVENIWPVLVILIGIVLLARGFLTEE